MYMEEQPKTKQEKKAEYNRRYSMKKKEEISERRKERLICDCGLEVCKRHLASHLGKSRHTKQLQIRETILQEKTNIDITKIILNFLD